MTPAQGFLGSAAAVVSFGRITATRTDLGRGRSSPTVQVRNPETTETWDRLLVASLYGVSSRARAGADAVVLFPGGNRGAGVVVATGDGRFTIDLKEDEVALHTSDGTHVHLKVGGKIKVTAATEVEIETTTLKVTGNVEIVGAALTHNGVNVGSSHTHGGVVTGGGNTSTPS